MSHRAGERVRVSTRAHAGHHRTPGYLKGRTGTIARVHEEYANPESLAYAGDGLPAVRLYSVSFEQGELWPEYRGGGDDRLYADLYEHWLEPPP